MSAHPQRIPSSSSRRSMQSSADAGPGPGLRARDVRQLETELEQEEERREIRQRRRLSQNSNTSYTRNNLQPNQRQSSSGHGHAHGALPSTSYSNNDAMRRRRGPPSNASNASRTSTVLSGHRQQPSRRIERSPGLSPPSGTAVPSVHNTHYNNGVDDVRTSSTSRAIHDSPLRRWCRLIEKTGQGRARTPTSLLEKQGYSYAWLRDWAIAIAVIVWIKWAVGLGGWSGKGHPPLYGDMEAQRHWLSLTTHLPLSQWYSHDLLHWGLDYPPLTAYHSYFLGRLAQVIGDPGWVELRGRIGEDGREVSVKGEEEAVLFMRGSVVVGDLLVYTGPVVGWCLVQLGRWGTSAAPSSGSRRSTRTLMIAFYSIMLQPGLILIDSGHFQYNSIMLGLTLISVLCFHRGRDSLGAVFFVASMCFKQMAIYYAPAIFGYLLGKCFWLGGNDGLNLFTSLGFFSLSSLLLFFFPFLLPLSSLTQSLSRIFPFQRGLFEDKVANIWCSLNVVVKLRELASVPTLVRLSAVITLGATVPIVGGMVWVSWQLRRAQEIEAKEEEGKQPTATDTAYTRTPAPTIKLLPHALFASSMAFFLFSFQVHEKSILLPLMPLTLLLAGKQPGLAGQDFEWAVLLNNVGAFSMYPLLKRDGLALPTMALTLFWNFILGYNPFSSPPSVTKYLSVSIYFGCFTVLFLDTISTPPPHLPDLYVVLNVLLSCAVFGLGWLWSLKRLVEEAWALVGLGGNNSTSFSPKTSTMERTSSGRHGDRLSSPSESNLSLPKTNGRRQKSPLSENGDFEDFRYREEDNRRERASIPRSASVTSGASSSRTATRRSRRSPLPSAHEVLYEEGDMRAPPMNGTDQLFPPAYSAPSTRRSHHRTASSASSNLTYPREEHESSIPFPRKMSRQNLGDISTHVSPSKTIVQEKRSPRMETFSGGGMRDEEERWRKGMLRDFD